MTITARRPAVEPTPDLGQHLPAEAAHRALLAGLYLEMSAEIEEAVRLVDEVGPAGDQAGLDDADCGTRLSEREQQLALLTSIRERREQIAHAIERLDAGAHGRCERCDEAIPPARLEAFPAVTTCVDCKRRAERQV